jgi:hypothetical protein
MFRTLAIVSRLKDLIVFAILVQSQTNGLNQTSPVKDQTKIFYPITPSPHV